VYTYDSVMICCFCCYLENSNRNTYFNCKLKLNQINMQKNYCLRNPFHNIQLIPSRCPLHTVLYFWKMLGCS